MHRKTKGYWRNFEVYGYLLGMSCFILWSVRTGMLRANIVLQQDGDKTSQLRFVELITKTTKNHIKSLSLIDRIGYVETKWVESSKTASTN